MRCTQAHGGCDTCRLQDLGAADDLDAHDEADDVDDNGDDDQEAATRTDARVAGGQAAAVAAAASGSFVRLPELVARLAKEGQTVRWDRAQEWYEVRSSPALGPARNPARSSSWPTPIPLPASPHLSLPAILRASAAAFARLVGRALAPRCAP